MCTTNTPPPPATPATQLLPGPGGLPVQVQTAAALGLKKSPPTVGQTACAVVAGVACLVLLETPFH